MLKEIFVIFLIFAQFFSFAKNLNFLFLDNKINKYDLNFRLCITFSITIILINYLTLSGLYLNVILNFLNLNIILFLVISITKKTKGLSFWEICMN